MDDESRLDYVMLRLLAGQSIELGNELRREFIKEPFGQDSALSSRLALDRVMQHDKARIK